MGHVVAEALPVGGALAQDLADSYVTKAGRAPYDHATPRVQAYATPGATPGFDPFHCRLPPALAAQLGAAVGDLVELAAPSGPARRLWVAAIDPSLPGNAIAASFDGAFHIRRLAAGRP